MQVLVSPGHGPVAGEQHAELATGGFCGPRGALATGDGQYTAAFNIEIFIRPETVATQKKHSNASININGTKVTNKFIASNHTSY